MSASQSRFYDTDPSDPGAPVVLDHYDGPHGPVAAGDLVAYVNPEALWLDESDGRLLTVEEIVSFGADAPPLAILTTYDGELWEVTANNLAPIQPVDGDTLTRHPDLRLRLILTIARTLAGRVTCPGSGTRAVTRSPRTSSRWTGTCGTAARCPPGGPGTAPPATTGPPRRSRSRGRRCDRDPDRPRHRPLRRIPQ